MDKNIVIVFETTNYAMQAENFIKNTGIKYQIMPTPREITQSCGISIKMPFQYVEEIKDYIEMGKINIKAIYTQLGSGSNKTIEKLM